MPPRWTPSTAIGVSLAAAGALIVGGALAKEWNEVVGSLAGADVGWLSAAFVLASGSMVGIALAWREALAVLGIESRRRDALAWYFMGELAKYVPGGPWAVVGRAEMAARGGVARSGAYAAVFLSLVATYLAGVLVASGFLPYRGGSADGAPVVAWLLFALLVGALAVHPAVLSRGLAFLRRWSRRTLEMTIPSWGSSMRLVVINIPSWLGVGLSTWCVTRALGASAPVGEIIFAALLSWLVGFIVVPAPGGLGVREAAFTVAVASLTGGVAAAAALIARVLFMLVDGVAAAGFGGGRWWRRTG